MRVCVRVKAVDVFLVPFLAPANARTEWNAEILLISQLQKYPRYCTVRSGDGSDGEMSVCFLLVIFCIKC